MTNVALAIVLPADIFNTSTTSSVGGTRGQVQCPKSLVAKGGEAHPHFNSLPIITIKKRQLLKLPFPLQ